MTADDERVSYLADDRAGASGGTDAELDPDERLALDELRALLADPALWVEPDPALEDQVVAAVTERAATGAPTVPRTAPARRRRHLPAVLGGLVAAAVLVVGLVVVSSGDDGGDTVEIALAPTDLVPGASGRATVTPERSGLRIELDATGLPRRDGGQYYQAWLRSETGELVPIGTFHEGDDIVLWAGVELASFPTLTVTEEQVEADQGSSGRRVLVGTLEAD